MSQIPTTGSESWFYCFTEFNPFHATILLNRFLMFHVELMTEFDDGLL